MDNNQPDNRNIINEQKKETSVTPQKVLTTASSLSSDNKVLAIISLILSFFSITFGIPLGIVALVMMKKTGDKSGIGFAVAAIAIGGIMTFLAVYSFFQTFDLDDIKTFNSAVHEIIDYFGEIFEYYFKKSIDKIRALG